MLVPAYWIRYGPAHFLWISDVALLLTWVALLRRSRLLLSVATLGALPFELAWNLDFWWRLFTGHHLVLEVTDYMFEAQRSLFYRGLSLFHVPLPLLWIWLLRRWGYDPRARGLQLVLLPAVLLGTWGLTQPDKNVNFVHLAAERGWPISTGAWVLTMAVAVPLLVYGPMHALLARFAGPRRRGPVGPSSSESRDESEL